MQQLSSYLQNDAYVEMFNSCFCVRIYFLQLHAKKCRFICCNVHCPFSRKVCILSSQVLNEQSYWNKLKIGSSALQWTHMFVNAGNVCSVLMWLFLLPVNKWLGIYQLVVLISFLQTLCRWLRRTSSR